MTGVSIQSLLWIIFGCGAGGALTVVVTSYRRLKTGKLSDEDSIITRLYRDNERLTTEALNAKKAEDAATLSMHHWREQAWQYRLQLIAENIAPKDLEIPPND